jgi:acetyl-CoA hydrolase
MIVTEYGVADLFGRSIAERAHALINIAHPKFRDELMAYAQQQHYVSRKYAIGTPEPLP